MWLSITGKGRARDGLVLAVNDVFVGNMFVGYRGGGGLMRLSVFGSYGTVWAGKDAVAAVGGVRYGVGG